MAAHCIDYCVHAETWDIYLHRSTFFLILHKTFPLGFRQCQCSVNVSNTWKTACGLNKGSGSQMCHNFLFPNNTNSIWAKYPNNSGSGSVASRPFVAAEYLAHFQPIKKLFLYAGSNGLSCGWLLEWKIHSCCGNIQYNVEILWVLKYTTSLGLAYGAPSSSAHPSSTTVCPTIDYLTGEKHYILQVTSCCLNSFQQPAIYHNIHHCPLKVR